MKKKRFMKLLALASCVTLLTGCESEAFFGLGKYVNQVGDSFNNILVKLGLKDEEKKEQKDSEQEQQQGEQGEQGGEQGGGEQEQPKTPKLEVAELPEKMDVREVLDLDDYVTLTNLESYSVELDNSSANLASVEGHKLTTLDEGEIAFTVSAGELSQKCSVTCVSEVREFLVEAFGAAKNRYTVLSYDYDNNDQLYVDDYYVHSDKYLLTQYFDYDANQNIVPGGWLSFEGEDLFEFTVQEDANGDDQIVLGDQASAVYFNVYNPEIEVDYYFGEHAHFEYDEQYDEKLLCLDADSSIYFAQEAIMRYQGKVTGQSATYYFDEFQFSLGEYEDPTTGETEQYLTWYAYVVEAGSDEQLFYGFGEILFGDDAGDEMLDAYCVPENRPAGVDYWYFMDSLYGGTGVVGLGDFFLSEDSLLYYPRGIYSLSYGWCDDNGDPIACPTDGNFSYMPVGSKLMFVSDNSAWDVSAVYDDTTGDFLGYSPNSGKMLVEGEGTDPDVVYDIFSTQTGYIAEVADEASVWKANDMLFAGLRDRANYAPGYIADAQHVTVEVPAQNEGEEPTQQYSHSVLTFQSGKVGGLIDALVAGDDGLYYLGVLIQFYAQYGTNLVDYFDGTLTLVPGSGVAQLRLSFGWDDNQNWAVTFTSQYSSAAAQQAQAWEAAMLTNVINAQ